MINIAICEDEKYYTEQIQTLISCQLQNYNIDVFYSGTELLNSNIDYDIIFMDIELPDCNGIKLLKRYNINSIIIIISSHKEEILNGYYVRALRFLLKPLDDFLFSEALTNAVNEIKKQTYIEVIDENNNIKNLYIKKVVYAEAGDKKTGLRTLSNFYYSNKPINKLVDYFNADFYFVHRSYIINMNFIDKIDIKTRSITMQEKSVITVSRLKWKDFRETFYKFLKIKMWGENHDI